MLYRVWIKDVGYWKNWENIYYLVLGELYFEIY